MNLGRSDAQWRKSSRSCDTANCVEVSLSSDHVGVRDTKDVAGPMLAYSARDWQLFVSAVRSGTLNPS
jgi:hypothetical protein